MRVPDLRAGLLAGGASHCLHCGEPLRGPCRCGAPPAAAGLSFGLLPRFASLGPRGPGAA